MSTGVPAWDYGTERFKQEILSDINKQLSSSEVAGKYMSVRLTTQAELEELIRFLQEHRKDAWALSCECCAKYIL